MLNFEFPPIGGGAGNANYYLLKEFAQKDYLKIDLITTSAKNTFEEKWFSNNIRVFKLNVRKKDTHYWRMSEIAIWIWKAYWFSNKLLNENDYNLSHCWFGWPGGIIGFLLKNRQPFIIALRGSDVPGYNERLNILDKLFFKLISKIIWRNASSLTALSHNLYALAKKTYSKKNIQIIHNGINLNEFKSENVLTEFCILFVGRLIKRKGVIFLLKAFKEICAEYSNCTLAIVGEGPEKINLIKYCNRFQIQTNVKFLGTINHNAIVKIYQKAKIFVLPSLNEAQSNVILEAMATGLPIITTNTGAAELMDGNGFIVEKGNYRQIKGAIIRYMENTELMKRHGQKSRKIAQKMSWKNTAQKYLKIYNAIN
jgi:glycosyltransferase involved in cell wall biosynthesis